MSISGLGNFFYPEFWPIEEKEKQFEHALDYDDLDRNKKNQFEQILAHFKIFWI